MGAGLVVLGIASAAAEGASAYESYEGEQAQQQAISEQEKEQQIQYQQKTINNYDLMQKTLDAQQAELTTRGVGAGSPSFNAIQRNTYNTGAKAQGNLNLEEDIAQQNLQTEKDTVRSKLYSDLFGDATSLATSGYGMASKAPSKLSSLQDQ